MIKFLLALFLALLNAQPSVRIGLNGTSYYSSVSGWTCVINFLQNSGIVRSEPMSSSYTFALYSDFDWIEIDDQNVINTISWSGTSCNCWIILFDDDGYEGDSIGLWTTNSTQGSHDLTAYNYMYDYDSFGDDSYKQWNTAVNAYKIYCY